MKIKFVLFCFVMLFVLCSYGADKELSDILSAHKSILWTIKPEQCEIITGVRVRPQDKVGNVMRYSSRDNHKYIRFEKRIVPEMIFYFEKRQLQSITVSIYNRGDDGPLNEKIFADLNDRLERFIEKFSGDYKPAEESRKFDKFRVDAITRRDKICDYVIRRNRKGKSPEYLQLLIYPAGNAKKLRESLRTTADKNQLQLNLNIDKDGSHYIDIPMVNQGAKGYCVGATVERIMKYYGSEIDQQIIAQLAESDAYKGTNIRKIINVLNKHKSRLKIRTDDIFTDDILTVEDLQKFTRTYNNFAKKQKRRRVIFDNFSKGHGRYKRVDFHALISNYEYDLFRDARCRNKGEVEKFYSEIYDSLSKGIPLAWVTFTFQNMREGRPIGKFGFHMRIINGFNQKKNQIIYTDSWGKGHEKKYMPIADARALTLMLIQITPK